MDEVRDRCVESNGAEKDLSSVISEYVNKVPCLKISYQLTAKDIKVELRRILRENLKKTGAFFVIICLIVLFCFVTIWGVIELQIGRVDYFHIFMVIIGGSGIGASVGQILFMSSFVKKSLKVMMDVIKSSGNNFNLSFYDDLLFVSDFNGMNMMLYSGENNTITENDLRFVISSAAYHKMISFNYIVPKRCLSDEEIAKIREYAKKFEERYIVKTKKAK